MLGKRPFDDLDVEQRAQPAESPSLPEGLDEMHWREPPRKKIVCGRSSRFLQDLQVTIELLQDLQDRVRQKPLGLIARAFELLSKEKRLRCCSLQTLRWILVDLLELGHRVADVLDTILVAMGQHIHSSVVQLEAVHLLQHLLTFSEKERSNSIPPEQRQRVLRMLFASMKRHPNEAALQYLSLDLIRRVARSPKECLSEGGIEAIWQTLENHPLIAQILQVALSLVAWMVEDVSCRDLVLAANGMDIIPSLMRLHAFDSWIQCNGTAALCWLVHAAGSTSSNSAGVPNNSNDSSSSSTRTRLHARHLPTVLDVLTIHQDNPPAFGNCLCLLCAISLPDHDGRVLKIVHQGMKLNLSSPQVQEGGMRWLRMRDLSRTTVEQMSDTVVVILDAMKYHEWDIHVQVQAIEVLAVIAAQDRMRAMLQERGAVDSVLDCYRRYQPDRCIQETTVLFLGHMTPITHEPHRTAFGGGSSTIVDVMWHSMMQQAIGDDENEDAMEMGEFFEEGLVEEAYGEAM